LITEQRYLIMKPY